MNKHKSALSEVIPTVYTTADTNDGRGVIMLAMRQYVNKFIWRLLTPVVKMLAGKQKTHDYIMSCLTVHGIYTSKLSSYFSKIVS